MIVWTLDDLVARLQRRTVGHQPQHLRRGEAALDERPLHSPQLSAGRAGPSDWCAISPGRGGFYGDPGAGTAGYAILAAPAPTDAAPIPGVGLPRPENRLGADTGRGSACAGEDRPALRLRGPSPDGSSGRSSSRRGGAQAAGGRSMEAAAALQVAAEGLGPAFLQPFDAAHRIEEFVRSLPPRARPEAQGRVCRTSAGHQRTGRHAGLVRIALTCWDADPGGGPAGHGRRARSRPSPRLTPSPRADVRDFVAPRCVALADRPRRCRFAGALRGGPTPPAERPAK